MQKNDDLLLDDELTAAFLGDELEDSGPLAPEPATLNEATSEEDVYNDIDDDIPGQLAVDMYETDEKLIIKARTAGVEKKDLDVSISDDLLTISGTLSSGEDIESVAYHLQECYWGDFTRTVRLPIPVREDEVEAVLKEGVLTISFTKLEQRKTTVVVVK